MAAVGDLFSTQTAAWFHETLGQPTDVQQKAWPHIAAGGHVLLTAPTGSGKTLAACLWALDRLCSGAWAGGGLRVLYISPMKALGADVRRNLTGPLTALSERFGDNSPLPRIATRSGDTPDTDRRRQRRLPPEILVITPESLNLLLADPDWLRHFRELRAVIIDEVHAVVDGKRGTLLATALERCTSLAGEALQRIALSATVEPLETVARFVAGPQRQATIVRGADRRPWELDIVGMDTRTVVHDDQRDDRLWDLLVPELRAKIQAARTSLLFCDSRRLAEKITSFINRDLEEPLAHAHHGSLALDTRRAVEARLKAGELRAVVATNSLELGIDIGSCDQVLLIGSPKSVASLMQRIGRADHQVGGVSRGTLYPLHPRDILDAAVLTGLARAGRIEALHPPTRPLDVLLQVILIQLSEGPQADEDLLAELQRCLPFAELSRAAFDSVIAMGLGRHGDQPLKDLRPVLQRDEQGRLERLPVARRLLALRGGVIPDRGQFQLVLADGGQRIGELDEECVWESRVGSRFAFAGRPWRITHIGRDRVQVVPDERGGAGIPFWRNEQQDRELHWGLAVGDFLEEWERNPGADRLAGLDIDATAQATLEDWLGRQKASTGGLPHRHRLVIERSRDQGGQGGLAVVHAPWGRRCLRPWSLALAEAWRRRYPSRLVAFATDAAILLHLPEGVGDEELQRFLCEPLDLDDLLRSCLADDGFFGARFRENAARALLLPRKRPGARTPLWLTRQRAKDLHGRVRHLARFPVLVETWRSVLEDFFDLAGLRRMLDELGDGLIAVDTRHVDSPGPFSADLVWQRTNQLMYEDDRPEGAGGSAAASALEEVLTSPDLRPPLDERTVADLAERLGRRLDGYGDEDLDALLRDLQPLPAEEWIWPESKGVVFRPGTVDLLALPDEASRWQGLLASGGPALGEALVEHLRRRPPEAISTIADRFGLGGADLLRALATQIDQGLVLRGALTSTQDQVLVAAEVYRQGLARQRRRARSRPVSTRPLTDVPRFLARWHGLDQPAQGEAALQQALERLFGWPAPVAAWEGWLLPSRIADYRPSDLDRLLAEDLIHWRGVGRERVTLCFPEALALFSHPDPSEIPVPLPSGGRSTFSDLLLAGNSSDSSGLAEQLWQAAWNGDISSDGWQDLRRGAKQGFGMPPLPSLAGRGGFGAWRASRPGGDRWFRLPESTAGDAVDELERARARIRQLLARHGVLFRSRLDQELPAMGWGTLQRALRLMELAGEVQLGAWFADAGPVQMASPEAAALLAQDFPDTGPWLVNASDPASGCGTVPDFPARQTSTWLVYDAKGLALIARRDGSDLTLTEDPDHPRTTAAVARLAFLLHRPVAPLDRIRIDTINGERAGHLSFRGLAETLAWRRTPKAYEWQR